MVDENEEFCDGSTQLLKRLYRIHPVEMSLGVD
jgi:hypothetical protein